MLRPLQPLTLREHQKVRLQVVPDEPINQSDEAIRQLVAAGLIKPPPGQTGVPPVSEAVLIELADRPGRALGQPLSEIIIEDRVSSR
jgi:hypothetical protein